MIRPNQKTYNILVEVCDCLNKMFQKKGHEIIIFLVPLDSRSKEQTWVAYINAGNNMLFPAIKHVTPV